jgi:glucose-6-phosphate 1-dehydrogenase
MEKPKNCILVIFGASGDLTNRKLLPAVFALFTQDLMPEKFLILGTGRTELNNDGFREKTKASILNYSDNIKNDDTLINQFLKKLHYLSIDTKSLYEYGKLNTELQCLSRDFGIDENYIFYLAVPPNMYQIISGNLHAVGLSDQSKGYRRIIIEKPFGYDLESAKELNRNLHSSFEEDQIYRIDHYLGKETVQNLLVTRFANGIFEPLWNRNYVNYIEITSAEDIGVENRGGYYESSGALRDMVQNHLLQITGLMAMEPPASFDSSSIRNEVLKVFQSLRPIEENEVEKYVIRGQYTSSKIDGKYLPGYREEKGVNPNSRTETYVALKFFIDNWRWGGVPFYIRTGKRLPKRITEIVIHFKQTPHNLFKQEGMTDTRNQFIIRIQPNEGILLKFGMKLPGSGYKVKNVNMDFHYKDLANVRVPAAYERLIYDCMAGDSTLYAHAEAVETAWKFVAPIQKQWIENPDIKLFGYPAGTWGPETACDLISESKEGWRYPCKSLIEDGDYRIL